MTGFAQFHDQSKFDDEIPGRLLPNIPDAVPRRVCPEQCNAVSCPKRSAHKGYQRYDMGGVSSYEKQRYLIDCHNRFAAEIRKVQGMLELMGITTNQIPRWEPQDPEDMRINSTPVWAEHTYEVVAAGSGSITCKFTAANDPINETAHQYDATVAGWGYATISNHKMGGHGGFIVYATTRQEIGAGGEGRLILHTANPVPSRMSAKANPSQPQTCTFRQYWGIARELWTPCNDIYPMWCHPETFVIDDPAAQEYTMVADGRAAPLGWPWTKYEKRKNGQWETFGGWFSNVPNGQGGHAVVADLRGQDFTGCDQARITYWREATPTASFPTERVVEIGAESVDHLVIADKRWDDTQETVYEMLVWDSGNVWKQFAPPNPIRNEFDGQGWYDVRWDMTGFDWRIYPPPPEDWPTEEPWNPEPQEILGARVKFYTVEKNQDEFLAPCGDRCAWSVPDYSWSVGTLDQNAKFHCYWWPALTADEKSKYQPRCFNQRCQYFAIDSMERGTLGAIAGICSSRPFVREQQMVGDANSWELRRTGAHSLLSLCNTDIQATGTRWKAREHFWGSGGWGRKVSYKSGEGQETHTETIYDPETGDPVGEQEVTTTFDLYSTGLAGGLEYINGTNTQGLAAKVPLTSWPVGTHRASGDPVGTHGRKIQHRRSVLMFPKIDPDKTEVQTFPDGELTVGAWKADLTKQEQPDEQTAYRMMVRLVNGARPFKDPNATPRGMQGITSVRAHMPQFNTGWAKLALRHKTISLSKPSGTGDEDVPVSAKIGGSNVLLPNNLRPTNNLAQNAIVGSGADGYVRAGMGLKLPDTEWVPEGLRNRILPIISAVACDADYAVVDPDWPQQWQPLENVMGLGAEPDTLKWCDSIAVDDPDGALAAINAIKPLSEYDLEIVESVWCTGHNVWTKSGPEVQDGPITGVRALPQSGIFYFPEVAECLVGEVDLADFMSVPSVSQDLQPIVQTIERMWG